MTPAAHFVKAKRIFKSMESCEDTDSEIVIEGAMLAINHCINAALHVFGICEENKDIIHTDYLYVSEMTRLRILAKNLLELLDEVEDLRAPYVRGCADDGVTAARLARANCRKAIQVAETIKPIGLPMVDYKPH